MQGKESDQNETIVSDEPAYIGHSEETGASAAGNGQRGNRLRRYIKKLGWGGFIFFLLKGLILYILVPLGLLKWLGC